MLPACLKAVTSIRCPQQKEKVAKKINRDRGRGTENETQNPQDREKPRKMREKERMELQNVEKMVGKMALAPEPGPRIPEQVRKRK